MFLIFLDIVLDVCGLNPISGSAVSEHGVTYHCPIACIRTAKIKTLGPQDGIKTEPKTPQ